MAVRRPGDHATPVLLEILERAVMDFIGWSNGALVEQAGSATPPLRLSGSDSDNAP